MKTFTIDVALVGRFEAKLDSFQKKFKKYGEGGITYEVSEPRVITNRSNRRQLVVDITVDASYKVAGYEFVASVETVLAGNLIKKISDDVFVPEIYRDRCWCDHCKSNRARKYTVILKNSETDEYIQVGKSCIKDYIGCDMSHYASYLEFYTELDESIEKMSSEFHSYTPSFKFEEIVSQTLEYTKRFGYVSKRQSYENGQVSTSTAVYAALNGVKIDGEDYEVYEVSEDSKEKFNSVLSFVNNLDDSSDYNNNLKVLATSAYIDNKNLGLAVSAVGYWIRETAKKKEIADAVVSEFVGQVGDKIEITAVPNCIYSACGEYGWSYIYKLVVDDNVFIWKTNKFLEEDEITVKAVIKEHSTFRGVKQTVITRGRVA
jgi:hypothetical protein